MSGIYSRKTEVIVYKREKRVCKECEEEIVIAPVANKLIEKGIPGTGLVAEILVSKYRYHLPLNRIAQRFQELGYEVSRKSMSHWVQKVVEDYLVFLGERLKSLILSSYLIQTDDSPLKVLDRSHSKNIKQGYYWYYIGDQRHVIIDYTPNRKRAGPGTFLSSRHEGLFNRMATRGMTTSFSRSRS